ncbi:GNAT family N-acetyltransferase, partial [Flavobacteriaceae bacterium]|nr:GNAT family N-acetyltransferase [Flavobacteriaceae bacterium]
MRIRLIEKADNEKIAATIRKVIIEMGAPKVGTAYEDEELEAMFEAYQKDRFIYFVVEHENEVLGGAGIAPLKNGDPSICELQ